MSLFIRELCFHERLHEFHGEFFTDDPCPQAQDVHVVVFDSLMSRIGVVTDTGSNAGNLIRGNADPHTASAEQDSTFRFFIENYLPDLHRVVGVIDSAIGIGAAINDFVTSRLNHSQDPLLEWKPAVITAERNSHVDELSISSDSTVDDEVPTLSRC